VVDKFWVVVLQDGCEWKHAREGAVNVAEEVGKIGDRGQDGKIGSDLDLERQGGHLEKVAIELVERTSDGIGHRDRVGCIW
jgi:hypothetical protein